MIEGEGEHPVEGEHPQKPATSDCESTAAIAKVIDSRVRDIGGLSVRRLLPAVAQRRVGPFVFFDHMGPARFAPGEGLAVRPHPHVGLATLTYLFEGEIIHRDSLGTEQAIRPGAINWMIAGSGIVHSERTREEEQARGAALHGIQLWIALPREHEEVAPSFSHHPADAIPALVREGVQLRVLAGTAYGVTAPVKVFSALFYVEAILPQGTRLALPQEPQERAAYVVEGSLRSGAETATVGRMLVFEPGREAVIEATSEARVMLLGGEPLPEERYLLWNFVSSRRERLEQAANDWKRGAFPKIPDDSDEFIAFPV